MLLLGKADLGVATEALAGATLAACCVRHYTGVSRAKAIMTTGVITPGERFRMYVEMASDKPLTPSEVEKNIESLAIEVRRILKMIFAASV